MCVTQHNFFTARTDSGCAAANHDHHLSCDLPSEEYARGHVSSYQGKGSSSCQGSCSASSCPSPCRHRGHRGHVRVRGLCHGRHDGRGHPCCLFRGDDEGGFENAHDHDLSDEEEKNASRTAKQKKGDSLPTANIIKNIELLP